MIKKTMMLLVTLLLISVQVSAADKQVISVSGLTEPVSGIDVQLRGDVENIDLSNSILQPVFTDFIVHNNDSSQIIVMSQSETTASGKLIEIDGNIEVIGVQLLNSSGNEVTGNITYAEALPIIKPVEPQPFTPPNLPSDGTIILKAGHDNVIVNGNTNTIDVAPYVKEGRTLVPLRFISEYLGAEIEWIPEHRKVVVDSKSKIELTIGSRQVSVSDKKITIDVAPELLNGRTMVPLRFVSEHLGANVSWDSTTEEITVKLCQLPHTKAVGLALAGARATS